MTRSRKQILKVPKKSFFLFLLLFCFPIIQSGFAASPSKLSQNELEKVRQNLGKSSSFLTKKPFVIFGTGAKENTEDEVSKGIKDLTSLNHEFRARVLEIQDALALEAGNAVPFSLVLRSKKADQFAIVDLIASLDDIPFLHLETPQFNPENQTLPLFLGPLPVGRHTIKLKIVAGKLIHGVPFTVSQGKWYVEKTFNFTAKKTQQDEEKEITFELKEGSPHLSMKEEQE